LLIQATVGCPWNRCTFCCPYKAGPKFKIRPVAEISEDLDEAKRTEAPPATLFLPAGNTIVMKTDDLVAVLEHSRAVFPCLERITVYGSTRYIHHKGLADLRRLARAGLGRIHVGLETGDDELLQRVRKGCTARQHIEAGQWIVEAGIEASVYVVLGLAGRPGWARHISETVRCLNEMAPHFIRLRTFMPKVNTPMLAEVLSGQLELQGPHGVLREARALIEGLRVSSLLLSDHYTNYLDVAGRLPGDRAAMLRAVDAALERPEHTFRPFTIGTA